MLRRPSILDRGPQRAAPAEHPNEFDARRRYVLFELPSILARRPSRYLAKGNTERTGLRVTQSEPHIRDRSRAFGQQHLGSLDSPMNVVLVRRNTKRLLEGPTEMMLAEAHQSR